MQRAVQVLERQTGGVGRQQRCGLQLRLRGCVERALGVRVLEDGLDQHVGAGHAAARHVGAQPLQRLGALGRGCDALLEQSTRARQRRLDVFQLPVLQRHRQSAQRAPRRDVPAHHPGADHVRVPEHVRRFSGQPLEPVLQQEDADQVAGGVAVEQRRDGARFGLEGRRPARPMTRPQLDHRVGGRIVLAAGAPGHLAQQQRLEQRAHARPAQRPLRQRRAARGRCDRDKLPRRIGQLLDPLDRAIDEPEPQGAIGAHAAPGEHQVHRGAHAQQSHAAHGAAESGVDAELHLR